MLPGDSEYVISLHYATKIYFWRLLTLYIVLMKLLAGVSIFDGKTALLSSMCL